MNEPKTIAFVADLHCGSHYGPWPESWLPSERGIASRYARECFESFCAWLPKKIDWLFLAGDLIDGKARKSKSTGLWSAKLGDQADGAIEILAPLVKRADKVFRCDGTPYHEDFEGALDKLDIELGVTKSQQIMDLELLDGLYLNVAHHPSSGGVLYKGTASDKESVWSGVASNDGTVLDPTWIVRAHKHSFFYQAGRRKRVCNLPCFKLQDPYAAKQNYWRYQPDIGGVLMIRDTGPRADASGYKIVERLFDNPIYDNVVEI